MQRDLLDRAIDFEFIVINGYPIADLDQMVHIDLHAGNKGEDRLLEEQQQHRRDRPQAGKQIKRIFFEQQGNENDDCGNPHEADADIEQTVDGTLLRMMLLFVPQAETPDGIYQRQCQKEDDRSPQNFADQKREPLVYSVAPNTVANGKYRQTPHERNDHLTDAKQKLRIHFTKSAVGTKQNWPQNQIQHQ